MTQEVEICAHVYLSIGLQHNTLFQNNKHFIKKKETQRLTLY